MNGTRTSAGIGVRGVEALIDLIVVLVIFYLVALATGHTTDSGFDLPTGHTLVAVGLSLVYSTVLEGLLGATFGKLATNLRVFARSMARRSTGAPRSSATCSG